MLDRPIQAADILIVDVDEERRCGRSRLLSTAGHRLLEASLDRETILMAAALEPHLVILTTHISDSRWIELCRSLKTDPATASIPLLLVCTRAEERVAALDAGADVCLAEPFTSDELSVTVRALLRWSRRGADEGRLVRRLRDVEQQSVEKTSGDSAAQLAAELADITERRQTEQELARARDHLALILESAGEAIYGLNMQGCVTFVNQAGAAMFGYRAEDLLEKNAHEMLHHSYPDRRAYSAHECPIYAALADGKIHRAEDEVFWHKDGRPIAVSYTSTPVWEGERLAGAVVVIRDITERRRVEAALRQSEERFRTIAQAVPSFLFETDAEGGNTWTSEGWCWFTGQTPEQVAGHGWADALHPEDRAVNIEQWAKCMRDGVPFESRQRLRSADGYYVWVVARALPVRDENGTIDRWVGSITDVDELLRSEEALRETEQKLRALAEQLEDLVEERTQELLQSQRRLRALASQLTLTEQQERRKLARDLHDYLAQLLAVGQMKMNEAKTRPALSAESRDLFEDVGQIFRQSLTYTRTLIGELSPPALHEHRIPEALRWLAERFKKDGLWVEVQADCDQVPVPEELAVMLFQSVRELLFNVLKHAKIDRAAVTVTVDPGTEVRVSVADRGKGLSPDAMRRGSEPGHLGLFGVRERLESFGGKIDIISAPGEGTTVTLRLPLGGAAAAGSELRVRSSELSGATISGQPIADSFLSDNSELSTQNSGLHEKYPIRVLLVDDHAMIRQGLRSVLDQHEDVEIVGEAGDGEEAVAMAARLTPDVVLMDINMPKMNGIDATKRIKSERPSTVVLVVTVHNHEQMKQAALAAGAIGFLPKETATEQLYETVTQAVKKGCGQPQC